MPGTRRIAAVAAALAVILPGTASAAAPTTPIEHLVVIFDENISFDHYFGTYPKALNPAGEPGFTAPPGTPSVNGLSGALLTANPNSANPFRLSRSQSVTCDNNHAYLAEQQAFNGGAMDKFVQFVSCGGANSMGYYDGNTVTALWNYASHYAMSDAYFNTGFGPSTPGHINFISGQTHGATPDLPGSVVGGTMFSNPQPKGDECGSRDPAKTASFGAAPNIGTLLSGAGVTWGWFQGGFRPTGSDAGGAVCGAARKNAAGAVVNDYLPHHEPFQYYDATRNGSHLAPASVAAIGHDDALGVNHQYDLVDFDAALAAGNLPAVSFLKAPAAQDGHGGYSGPVDEQRFMVEKVNAIQKSSAWPTTAIVITYDDSDGWYDHQPSPIVNSSHDATYDALNGPGACDGPPPPPPTAGGFDLRCGFGPRLPLLVVSPYSRINQVDHTTLDQTSVMRFIEDNWQTGRIGGSSYDDIPAGKPSIAPLFDFSPGAARAPTLALDPETGAVPAGPQPSAPPVLPPVVAARAARGLTLTVKPKRDRRRPFAFKASGQLLAPDGVAPTSACIGLVTVSAKAGTKTVKARKVNLTGACGYKATLRTTKRGRLTIRARFTGNASVLALNSAKRKVRAG